MEKLYSLWYTANNNPSNSPVPDMASVNEINGKYTLSISKDYLESSKESGYGVSHMMYALAKHIDIMGSKGSIEFISDGCFSFDSMDRLLSSLVSMYDAAKNSKSEQIREVTTNFDFTDLRDMIQNDDQLTEAMVRIISNKVNVSMRDISEGKAQQRIDMESVSQLIEYTQFVTQYPEMKDNLDAS